MEGTVSCFHLPMGEEANLPFFLFNLVLFSYTFFYPLWKNIIYSRNCSYFYLSYCLSINFSWIYVKEEMFYGIHLLHTYTGYHCVILSLSFHQILKLKCSLHCCNILFYKIISIHFSLLIFVYFWIFYSFHYLSCQKIRKAQSYRHNFLMLFLYNYF